MKLKLGLILLAVALVAAGCNKSKTVTTSSSNSQDQSSTTTQPVATTKILMTASGFQPKDIIVKVGTEVEFQNVDTQPHWPASNPHPTHTDLPGFDALQAVNPGASYKYTFTKVGTWGFHDHLNSTKGGTVAVFQ